MEVHYSSLKHIEISPRHFLHAAEGGITQTPAMKVGSALHALVLEGISPKIMPRLHKSWKDETAKARGWEGGKESYIAWLGAGNNPDDFITVEEAERVHLMAVSVREQLEEIPPFEAESSWGRVLRGVACGGKSDILTVNGAVWDVKTYGQGWITDYALMLASKKNFWPEQLVMYEMGHGLEPTDKHGNIVVESQAPYCARILRYSPERLDQARTRVERWIDAAGVVLRDGDKSGPNEFVAGPDFVGGHDAADEPNFDSIPIEEG